MSNTRTIPNDSRHGVITFDILSDNQPINSGYQVLSLSVSKEINRIPTAKIVFIDGDSAEEKFEISDTSDFIPGKKIHIKLGYDSNNATVFKGIITKHAIKIRGNGSSMLIVECKDEAVRMTLGRHSKYFEQVKDSEAIEALIGQYSGLTKNVESTNLKHRELVQHHVSDWDFMLLRADANGKLVIVNDGKISVKKPNTSEAPALSLTYGSTIFEFEAEIDARTQWKSVKSRAWDYTNQAIVEAEKNSSSVQELGNISGSTIAESTSPQYLEMMHSGKVQQEELQALSDALIQRSRLSKVRGRVKFLGVSIVKVGKIIELHGVGDRFNGKAFVTGVYHEVEAGTWFTHCQFGLSPERYVTEAVNIEDSPSSGLVSGVHGLQIGVVVKLEQDPEGEDRIQVRLPTLDANNQGIWMRIASLDAGNQRGAFFRPEIGDEVIVGFINDDPRDGVVLGMLHSSKNPAPIVAKDTNHEKGFTTRSKMHIAFDDEKKRISIDTPAGNSIVIDESAKSITLKDQNNNKIEMTPSGIEMKSPKNITIDAGMVLTLKGGQSVEMSAPQIAVKADASVEIKGAMAKVAASGIAEISGSLVKIN
jgi:Rhs element Vgr protein